MYKINLLFIIFVGLLASCYSKPISIITEETIRPPLSLNLPPPIELKNMEFYILKRENALKIFDKLEKNKKAPIIIGMSVEDYKNLAMNLDDLNHYIAQQNKIIDSYKKYYEGVNK